MGVILENETQRELILGMIEVTQFKGAIVDQVADLKQKVRTAIISEPAAAPQADKPSKRARPKLKIAEAGTDKPAA